LISQQGFRTKVFFRFTGPRKNQKLNTFCVGNNEQLYAVFVVVEVVKVENLFNFENTKPRIMKRKVLLVFIFFFLFNEIRFLE